MSGKCSKISRRKFIDLGIQGYAGLQFSHLAHTAFFPFSSCNSKNTKKVHGVCYHDCPDSCSWDVILENGNVIDFGGNKDNPYTNGKLCGKMETFPNDVTFNPERILYPLKRTGKKGEAKFERIDWDQALEEVGEKLRKSVGHSGGESVLPFGYMGTQGLLQKDVMSKRFFTKLGASNLAETICGATAVTGNKLANGQVMGVLPEDIVHSRYIILWGTNTKNANVHLWPYVMEARKRGAKITVIDPFRSATAMEADSHIQLMPGTDVAIALAMMHVIINEGLTDDHYIENHTLGFDALKAHVQKYDPTKVAAICRIDASSIVDFTREYARAKPSLIRFLIGMEHNYNGGDAFRSIGMLPSLTGAWREHGGGLMHLTYELFGEALNFDRLNFYTQLTKKETRWLNMVQLGSLLNDPELNPEINTLFVFNANPVVTIPDQNLIRKGLEREDLFTVVMDHFITDTAKYADFIFPATTQLEHWDVADSWGQVYVNLNQPAIEPLGESKSNNEFFRLLAKEMAFSDKCFDEKDNEIAKSIFDTEHPYMKGITFEFLKKTGWARLKIPEPYLPHAEGNFGTFSGKCEFYSSSLEASGQALPEYKTAPHKNSDKFPLQLLTVKATRAFHNSSHANIKHLLEAEGPPTLDMNRVDAKKRKINDGDQVMVKNENGEVLVIAKIRNRIRPGVVLMPHGFWPSLVKGGSTSNALTSGLLADHGGGAALQDCQVEVIRSGFE